MSNHTDTEIKPAVDEAAPAPTGENENDPNPTSGDFHEPATDSPQEVSRRKFLSGISLALTALGGLVVGVPMAGFVIGPLLETKTDADVWQPVYTNDHRNELNPTYLQLSQMTVGDTIQVNFRDPSYKDPNSTEPNPQDWAGLVGNMAAWLRRDTETTLIAFSVNCTHLGCPVTWLPNAGLFMCPCHGGVYYKSGDVAAGPPPQSLPRYDTRITNGNIELKITGVKLND